MPQSYTDLLQQAEKTFEKDGEFYIKATIRSSDDEEENIIDRHPKADIYYYDSC